MKHNTGIYQIVNQVNGKKYIGSASFFKKRKHDHFNLLKINKHHTNHLQNSYNKYGENNFKFEILLYCNKENLIFYEQRAIDSYDFNNELYNIAPIAGSSLGIKHTNEAKKNMSKAKKGIKASNYTKKKMSNARKGSKNCNYGKIGCESYRSKSVYQINKDSLEIIKKWNCISDVGRELNITANSISATCKKKVKTAGGFIWAYTYSDISKIKKIKRKGTKSLYQINKDTNKIINKWDSAMEVRRELKILHVQEVCKGKRNTAGGFKWKYVK